MAGAGGAKKRMTNIKQFLNPINVNKESIVRNLANDY